MEEWGSDGAFVGLMGFALAGGAGSGPRPDARAEVESASTFGRGEASNFGLMTLSGDAAVAKRKDAGRFIADLGVVRAGSAAALMGDEGRERGPGTEIRGEVGV